MFFLLRLPFLSKLWQTQLWIFSRTPCLRSSNHRAPFQHVHSNDSAQRLSTLWRIPVLLSEILNKITKVNNFDIIEEPVLLALHGGGKRQAIKWKIHKGERGDEDAAFRRRKSTGGCLLTHRTRVSFFCDYVWGSGLLLVDGNIFAPFCTIIFSFDVKCFYGIKNKLG